MGSRMMPPGSSALFSYADAPVFSDMVPGCYYNIGSTIPGNEVYDIHHPKFNPDERLLRLAIESEVLSALRLMEE